MLADDLSLELEKLRWATLTACRRLRATKRRALLFLCLRAVEAALDLTHDDPRLYRSLHECRKTIQNALHTKPRSRLAFTRSLRDHALRVCRDAGLWGSR